MCRFSGYHFRLFFLEQDIKRRQIFWSRLSKHVKRKFCYNGLLFSPIFVFLSILFTDFFWNRVSFEGKNSRAGEKKLFSWAHPRTNLGQVSPHGVPLLKGILFPTFSLAKGILFDNFYLWKGIVLAIMVQDRSNFGNSCLKAPNFGGILV